MYRTLLGLVAAILVALGVVWLTFAGTSWDRADFVFVNGTEPKTLDPQKMTGQPEGRIAEALLEGLTFNEPTTLRPVPGAAESWEVAPDGLRWTFRLREGLRWSNGDPVTAHDFVYAWVRLQEPKVASEYAYLLHMIRHAEAYNRYGGQVAALRGDPEGEDEAAREGLLAGLRALGAGTPGGVTAKAWRQFRAQRGVGDAVAGTAEPALLAALAEDAKDLADGPAREVLAAMEREAAWRSEALADARAHFGKDQGVFAPDDRTFVVELRAFTPYFLDLTAFYPTLPVHRPTVERWPESWFLPGRIVGNGPFVMEAWDVNRRIRLARSPTYWARDVVSLRTVEALPIESSATALNLYLTGEADWAPAGFPLDVIDQVKKRPDFYRSAGMGVYYYRFNCTVKPFDDPRVRLALSLAFDRQELVDFVTRGGQLPATTFVAPGVPGYVSPPSRLGHDPAEARRLLAEAGFPGGRGFPRFAILYNTLEAHKKIAEYVAASWKETLGIDVNAVNQEWQSYQEDVRRLNYTVSRAAWIGDYRDPNTFLDMWTTGGGNNQTGWGDPRYDRLIALAADPLSMLRLPAAEAEALFAGFREGSRAAGHLRALREAADPAARLASAAELRLDLFREAEALLFQEAYPVCPVYFYVYTGLVSPQVEGFYSRVRDEAGQEMDNLQDSHPLRELRVRRPGGDGGR